MQRPEFVPCCTQVQLEWGKSTATRTMASSPAAQAHDQHTQYAGGPEVGHFQWKCENRDSAPLRRLLCNELATPDLLLLHAGCPGPTAIRSGSVGGHGHRVCVSAGNRIFRFLADPSGERRNLEKCSEEVRSGSGCVLRPIRMYINRSGALDRTSPFLL